MPYQHKKRVREGRSIVSSPLSFPQKLNSASKPSEKTAQFHSIGVLQQERSQVVVLVCGKVQTVQELGYRLCGQEIFVRPGRVQFHVEVVYTHL